ncbi:ATP-dependent helicase [Pseudomonas sp. CFBP13508]|uniref:UvrD-helicase domain-containing protein n=1 Tax=Pseudomonas sp. CFBP13508 TaxID=2184009 RepID=UPI0010BFECB6|nr:ATP-dependent helicase [Pseudomonas sp. CFBP13508]TKJ70969.1 ATP-dependent helicase [Pseudomonas sp. CFBP13508]
MPLKSLTKEQYDAATYNDNLLLTACPGSGKTKTLVAKIAYKLQTHDLRRKILVAITYTNIAADTIVDRLDAFSIPSDNLWIGTIHSFCLEWIIKPYRGHSSRTSKGYRLLDQYESQEILDTIKSELKLKNYEKIITKLQSDGTIQTHGVSRDSIRAAQQYHNHLVEHKLIDFDLILSTAAEILKNHPSIGQRLSHLFDSIFIDEYQDTNQTQYDIMREILKHGSTKVCLIGDIDQAIYTGLGAIVKNSTEICVEFSLKKIETMTLSGCFRSKQQIVDFYSEFQDHKIPIQSLQDKKFPLEILAYDKVTTRDDLPKAISYIVQKHLSLGVLPSEIAILHPQWYEATSLGREVSKILPNTPFDAPGLSPIPHCHENIWYKLIRLHHLKKSNKNYNRRTRLANEILLALQGMAVNVDENFDARSLLRTSNRILINEADIIGYIHSLTQAFCAALGILVSNHRELSEQYDSLVKATNTRINKDGIDRDTRNLSKYFNELTGVKVTTCHSTKGDEYEVVICAGLLEGRIPHWDEIINKNHSYSTYMARRLLYVISSRAKSALYLFSEKGIYTASKNEYIPTKQLSIAASKLKL